MDKSILEKRIHDKAEERADKYFEMISSFFRNERELRSALVLKPNSKEKVYFRTDYNGGSGIFDSQDILSKYTNWQDIRKELVEKYEKEETDNILSKLDSINYLLEGE